MNTVEENGKLSLEHEINHKDCYSEVQFWPIAAKDDDFGVISNSKSSPSPSRLSPGSRAQAIARGRLELMEMVRNMPESNYELSLKDIVEHHHRADDQNQAQIPKPEDYESLQRGAVKVKKQESKRIDRNLSFENKGLFLNMVLPFPFLSNKKKKNGGGNSGRVSPKPEGLKAGGERDWWKKKFTGSSDSDSSRTSNNSGTSSSTASSGATVIRDDGGDQRRRRINGFFIIGCFQIFNSIRRRSKSAD